MRRLLLCTTALVLSLLSVGHVLAYSVSSPAPGFGPDQYQNLITNTQFTSVDMVEADITAFLKKQSGWAARDGGVSWLSDYVIPEYQTVPYKYTDGSGTCQWSTVSVHQYIDSASEALFGSNVAALIARKSAQKGIAAEVILATLEKESTAITRPSPQSDATEMWVLGYGWNDTMASCGYNQAQAQQRAHDWGGVGQQIAYAMNGLRNLYNTYASTFSNGFVSSDGAQVYAQNAATRALFAYTPYVYNGNYNFWFLMQKWFAPTTYKPVALTLDATTGTVYVIDEGQKWPVTGPGFVGWNFNWNDVVPITSIQLALPTGNYWTNLTLGSDGTVYYIDNGHRRPLTSARLMDRYHFNWADVQMKSDALLSRVPYGLPMHELVLPTGDGTVFLATASTLYPVSGNMFNNSWGFAWSDTAKVPAYVVYNLAKGPLLNNVVVADGGDGSAYFIDNGTTYPLSAAVGAAWGMNLSNIEKVGPALIADLKQGAPMTTLAMPLGGDGTVYLIKNQTKYPVSGTYFNKQGFKGADIRTVSGVQFDSLPTGSALR